MAVGYVWVFGIYKKKNSSFVPNVELMVASHACFSKIRGLSLLYMLRYRASPLEPDFVYTKFPDCTKPRLMQFAPGHRTPSKCSKRSRNEVPNTTWVSTDISVQRTIGGITTLLEALLEL